jgi:anaerobic selenocysteine-containing dehydrogenase
MDVITNHSNDNSTQGKSMSDRTWQSLDHLAGDTLVKGEFDGIKEALTDSKVSRRGFMTIMSASMALTAAACRRPIQHLVPSTKSHQTAIPGMPIDYTSVYTQRNVAYGALVTSREGRPVRVKGNDKHGVNIGRASVEMQASLLSLYDPERLRRPRVRRGGGSTSYDNAVGKIAAAITDAQAAGKKAVAVINEHASPSYAQLLADMSAAIPAFSTVMMPAIIADGAAAANRAMLGVDAEIAPDLSKAKVVVCVDADPLGADKLSLYHTTRFSQMRSPSSGAPSMSTIIVAEAQYSLTGANSDVRHRLHPSQVEPYLAVLEAEIAGSGLGSDVMEQASAETQKNAKAAAAALKTAQGSAVVMTGRHLSARANGMAIAINNALGAIGAGKIIDPTHVIPNSGVRGEAIAQLVADLEADRVHALIFVDTNPEYTADRAFRSAMIKAPVRAAVNLYADETALVCDIDIPGSHWLESWGDAVAIDGTMSVQQPLIAPLNDGIGSTQDTLMNIGRKVDAALFADTASYYDYVVARWSSIGDWRTVLLDGAVAPTATETNSSASVNTSAGMALKGAKVESGMTVMTVPSLTLYDGYYGNNAWLLELSDPVTKVTWENLAMMSPATAEKMGLVGSREPKALARANGKIVSVSTSTGTLDLPLWIQPGMADDTIAVSLGFGHQAGGEVAMGKGES